MRATYNTRRGYPAAERMVERARADSIRSAETRKNENETRVEVGVSAGTIYLSYHADAKDERSSKCDTIRFRRQARA